MKHFTVDRLDGLESLVAAVADDYAKPPNIVVDFVTAARAAAGLMRLTAAASSARERELQRACRSWLGLSPKVFGTPSHRTGVGCT